MSSSSFTANVLLNGREYSGLDNRPEYINEWFEAWKGALKRKSFRDLLTLTHWGLQLPLCGERDKNSVARLICHYLAVADGHQSAKNFGHHGPANGETDFGAMSHGERMQKLSDKAWTELCNRVFVFGDDGFGRYLKYARHFRQPSLAAAFIRFIDPDRWRDGSFYRHELANIDRLDKSAYHAKAYAFTRRFLQEAWLYRQIVERENAFSKDPGQCAAPDLDEAEAAEVFNGIQFFRRLKPQIARLMIHYGMEDFLHDQKLDHPTRSMLRKLAFGNTSLRTPAPDREKMDLAQAYGQLDPEYGRYFTLGHREVARVLLLYPYLVKGRREYVREQVRKKLAAKAAEAGRLQDELEAVTAKLEALR